MEGSRIQLHQLLPQRLLVGRSKARLRQSRLDKLRQGLRLLASLLGAHKGRAQSLKRFLALGQQSQTGSKGLLRALQIFEHLVRYHAEQHVVQVALVAVVQVLGQTCGTIGHCRKVLAHHCIVQKPAQRRQVSRILLERRAVSRHDLFITAPKLRHRFGCAHVKHRCALRLTGLAKELQLSIAKLRHRHRQLGHVS